MTRPSPSFPHALALVLTVATAGCSDETTEGQPVAPTPIELDATEQAAFEHLVTAYGLAAPTPSPLWHEADDGGDYRLDQIPFQFIKREASGANVAGFLVGHDSPPAEAQPVDHPVFATLGPVHRYDGSLAAFGDAPFDFTLDVGGTKTLTFPFQAGDPFGADPDSPIFLPFLVHEGFHRYQQVEGAWTDPPGWVQAETVPWSRAPLALTLLENAILAAGLQGADADTSLKQLVAVRNERAALPESTVDGVNAALSTSGQEWNEGTPTYVERRLAEVQGITPSPQDPNTVESRIAFASADIFETQADASNYFAHSLPYGTGAAIGLLLEEVGVDWRSACRAGTTPFASAEAYANLSAAERMTFSADAKSAHDFDGAIDTATTALLALP